MNTIEPLEYQKTTSEPAAGGMAAVAMGFLILMFLMYDHFERQIRAMTEQNIETQARFAVTEDRLATMGELEEDVRELMEAEEERKSSWEDDVLEPNKYQAILGTGTVEGVEYEFRFIREKLNTFKSNRYWLMAELSPIFIHHFLWRYFKAAADSGIIQTDTNPLVSHWEPNDIDYFIRIDCRIVKNEMNKPIVNFTEVFEEARKASKSAFKWKRALIDCPADS